MNFVQPQTLLYPKYEATATLLPHSCERNKQKGTAVYYFIND